MPSKIMDKIELISDNLTFDDFEISLLCSFSDHLRAFQGVLLISKTRRKRLKQVEIIIASPLEL